MTAHLPSLSALHAAAPGVLGVIFGPDGDFEGAPNFVGPLLDTVERRPAYQYVMVTPGLVYDWATMTHYALDLRVPSVAARLAGLCARALGQSQPIGWWVGEANPEWCLQSSWGTRAFNWRLTGVPYGTGLPVLPRGLLTCEAFLAALTLALAPRIAALGGAR